MNSDGYLPSREAAREISTTFNETELNNCSSIYYTDRTRNKFISFNIQKNGRKLNSWRMILSDRLLGGE